MSPAIYIIEEHNEAFYLWWKALQDGTIGAASVLLHFDDHADFRYPILNRSIYDLADGNDRLLEEYVRKDLHIDSFVVPAIFAGLVGEYWWIRQGVEKTSRQEKAIRTFNDEGKYFLPATPDDYAIRPYTHVKTGPNGFPAVDLPADTSVLLDIDLDYFSCCENPYIGNEIIIEVTRQEYEEFVSSPYHYLHFITAHAEARTWNGSYFLVLNRIGDAYPSRREVTESEILHRIRKFVNDLANRNIQPVLITVCRSLHSGFTPRHQWEFIEDHLLSALACLYPSEPIHIGAVMERSTPGARIPSAISK